MDYVLLPKLNSEESGPASAGTEGTWYSYPKGRQHLVDYANALVVPQAKVPAERIKSTPSPWARALLFEQALFTRTHPSHHQVLGEWRGLLACLGLAGYLGVTIEFTQVNLAAGDSVLDDLRVMLPEDLARLWRQIVLVKLTGDGHSVTAGATSPRTIVFTGIRGGVHPRVPFATAGRLIDPTAYYRQVEDTTSLTVLKQWIDDAVRRFETAAPRLLDTLGKFHEAGGAGADTRIGYMTDLLREWQSDTARALADLGGATSDAIVMVDSVLADEFTAGDPLHPLYAAIRGTKALQLAGTNALQVVGEHVVADPIGGTVVRNRNPYNGRLRLPAGQSRDVTDGRVNQAVTVDASTNTPTVNFASLFEPRLLQMVGNVAEHTETLRVDTPQGSQEYLYPFSPAILTHITQEHLRDWTSIVGDGANGFTVTLEVPIGESLSIRYARTYRRDAIVDDFNAPELVVWPDFESPTWTDYYYATFQLAKRGNRLNLEPVVAGGSADRVDADGQGLRWGRLNAPPRVWTATDVTNPSTRGLLINTPAPYRYPVSSAPNAPEWDVAIDFGSTQTRVFRREGAGGDVVEVKFQPRTRVLVGTRDRVPFYFFAADAAGQGSPSTDPGVPSLLWLPLGGATHRESGWLPADGHIFWGVKIDDRQGKVFGNLKWRRDDESENASFHNFITQVFVSVAAEAAVEGARIGSVITAYPSVLPGWLRQQHHREWQAVADRFKVKYRPALSESDAVATYLVKKKKGKITRNMLAVDVGGSTADFAIWRNNRQYLDSIQMAGSIFNRLMGKDRAAREAVSAAARPLIGEEFAWAGDESETRNRILASLLLRKVSQSGPAGVRRFGENLYATGPGSPGERVLAHVAYLFAVISFTLGMLTGRDDEGTEDNFSIFFAGRGASLLNWVDALAPDAAKMLVGRFFRAGLSLGVERVRPKVNVSLPEADAKEEVARGLLMSEGRGPGASDEDDDDDSPKAGAGTRRTIVGESCYMDGENALEWRSELTANRLKQIVEPKSATKLNDMIALRTFVATFDTDDLTRSIAEALGIESHVMDENLRDLIHERIFGQGGTWQTAKDKVKSKHLILEPFFVTEAKALLEQATGNSLFEG